MRILRPSGLRTYQKGRWINADDQGRNSKAERRGYDEKPVWYHYTPNPDYTHQAFNYVVHEH